MTKFTYKQMRLQLSQTLHAARCDAREPTMGNFQKLNDEIATMLAMIKELTDDGPKQSG
jgi:hypothetical protein